ncbi:hypothetical protein GNF82_20500 [Clostridium perfringens]
MMTTRKEALPTPQSMKYAVRRALRSSLLELGSGTKAELSDRHQDHGEPQQSSGCPIIHEIRLRRLTTARLHEKMYART